MNFGDAKFAFGSCDLTELKCINSGVSPDVTTTTTIILLMILYVITIIIILLITIITTIDENILNLTNCRYYTVSEFHNSADNHSLNIFHNNVNGLKLNLKIYIIFYQMLPLNLILSQ